MTEKSPWEKQDPKEKRGLIEYQKNPGSQGIIPTKQKVKKKTFYLRRYRSKKPETLTQLYRVRSES